MRYTELQISSELLDQPEFAGQPKKIFICSTPRSGSYFLCRQMINAGMGVPHEYFNPIVMAQMAPRLGLEDDIRGLTWLPRHLAGSAPASAAGADRRRSWPSCASTLSFLLARRCQGGVFAAKVHFRDFRRTLNNSIGDGLLENALFIQLHREDILKQAVSEHFGQLTGPLGNRRLGHHAAGRQPQFLRPGCGRPRAE